MKALDLLYPQDYCQNRIFPNCFQLGGWFFRLYVIFIFGSSVSALRRNFSFDEKSLVVSDISYNVYIISCPISLTDTLTKWTPTCENFRFCFSSLGFCWHSGWRTQRIDWFEICWNLHGQDLYFLKFWFWTLFLTLTPQLILIWYSILLYEIV